MHLVRDGHDCDTKILQNQKLITTFLEELPNKIGMSKLMSPKVNKYAAKNEEDWGISGFVIIAESHISVHTFPARKYINIDVFSCKNFNVKEIISEVKKYFKLKNVKYWKINRGINTISTNNSNQSLE